MLTRVYLPAAAPFIVAGIRLGFGMAMKAMVIAELWILAGTGELLETFSRSPMRLDLYYPLVLLIIGFAVLVNVVLLWAEQQASPSRADRGSDRGAGVASMAAVDATVEERRSPRSLRRSRLRRHVRSLDPLHRALLHDLGGHRTERADGGDRPTDGGAARPGGRDRLGRRPLGHAGDARARSRRLLDLSRPRGPGRASHRTVEGLERGSRSAGERDAVGADRDVHPGDRRLPRSRIQGEGSGRGPVHGLHHHHQHRHGDPRGTRVGCRDCAGLRDKSPQALHEDHLPLGEPVHHHRPAGSP